MIDRNVLSGDDESASAIKGRFERIKAAEKARQALLDRPRLSLRLQIYLAFGLAFLLSTGIALALVVITYQMENQVVFLGIVNDYAMEVEEARRFEKNFFLYGTGLDAAQQSVYQAKKHLLKNTDQLARIVNKKTKKTIFDNLERYDLLLERLHQLERGVKKEDYSAKKKELEIAVRQHGRSMVVFALDLLEKEKKSMSASVALTRKLHIYSMIILAIAMIIIASFLGQRVLGNITRFELYARRIASGDFTPIMPARRYRDEFTDLAVSVNDMLQELESHGAMLIQSHKMRAIGTLTSGVAHELNNPLNNITLTSHMLLEDYADLDDPERKEMVEEVIEEAGRAKSIVANLLDFARESGTKLEPISLAELVKNTVSLAGNEIKLAGLKVSFNATDNLPRVHGDSQQLRQVFLNLLLNAVAASEKGGNFQVLVLPADDPQHIAVKVIDFGVGIPENIVDRIFDPFFTTKEKGKGTGLGLSVSQGIVAKHGGEIRVSSREGQGTTFTVTLPVTTITQGIDS